MRAATSVQPRKNSPPLVPKFKQVISQQDSAPLPPQVRKLSTPKRGYVRSAPENHVTARGHFSPEEFLREALPLQHPTQQQSLFPKEVKTNVEYLSTSSVHQIAMERKEQVRRWTILATDLADEERKLKASLRPRDCET